MPRITINSNIAALNAQRRFASGTQALRQNFERLSSGLRINRPHDDAAGLSIAEDLRVDRRVFLQGIKNLNDGISVLNIADGALAEMSNTTTRIKELAFQASNGTLSAKQRKALDDEAQALAKEFSRIANSTTFNGRDLLKGALGELALQVGYGEKGSVRLGASEGQTVIKGDGTFTPAGAFGMDVSPYFVITGDFNNDGVTDLATAHKDSGEVGILLGNGDGTFLAPVRYGAGADPQSIVIGDFNGDGVSDLATSDRGLGKVWVLLGNGDGTFKASSSHDAGIMSYSVTAGDFNGDGVTDLVSADALSQDVRVLLGNGDGTFKAPSAYSVGSTPRSVITGDFNGDGITDLVTADSSSNQVSVLLGNGDGTFMASSAYSVGSNPRSVIAGDFNGDGITDLATADTTSAQISVLLGNGNGTFKASSAYSVGSGPQSVISKDINGDGVDDLVSADTGSNQISVLISNGDGTFLNPVTYGVGSNPQSVTVGDFNRDGILDVATADYQSLQISILFGNSSEQTISADKLLTVSPFKEFSLKTRYDALQSFTDIEQSQEQIYTMRGIIGAFHTRLETALRVTSIRSENLAAAESQIRDVDVADEASHLARNQILQQAGAAVLSQANRSPALALTLLEGL